MLLYAGLSQQCDIYARYFIGVELYDPTEPARGFTLKYGGGDPFTFRTPFNRTMEISFICDDNGDMENVTELNDLFNAQGSVSLVAERNSYYVADTLRIEIYTSGGCPARCQTYADEQQTQLQLCNGNGVCREDEILGNVRCICDDDDPLSDPYYCKLETPSPVTSTPTTPSPVEDDMSSLEPSTTYDKSNGWMIGMEINLVVIGIMTHFVY